MLESIWTLLGNYGLDLTEIADAMASLFKVVEVVEADGSVTTTYEGSLAALADFPVIGEILKAFASLAPVAEETLA